LSASGITDNQSQANILAQIKAESNFKPQSENLNYSGKTLMKLFPKKFKSQDEADALAAQGPEAISNFIYGGRMGNAGDEGYKYRGRGLIQLTGKDNYSKFSKLIGVDLVKDPDLANDPEVAEKIAVAYFKEASKKYDLSDIKQTGKAVGYAGGKEETDKRTQYASAFANNMPTAEVGGILSGPKSGYTAMLHNTEAVVPLPDGRNIPVQMTQNTGSSEQMNMMAMQLNKLDAIVRTMEKANSINNKILQRQS